MDSKTDSKASQSKEFKKEHPEEKKIDPAKAGSVTGKASGDIFQHAPTGPIVGEVFKSRADLNTPKTRPAPGVNVPTGKPAT